MGWLDYVSDLYSSVTIQSAAADVQDSMHNQTGEFSTSKEQNAGGRGTPQQDRGARVAGGASTTTPHSGTNEESDEEAEVNKATQKKGGDAPKGVTPGEDGAKEAAGQVGADKAGPHGGPVGGKGQGDENAEDDGGDEEEEEDGGDDEEEEEEEEEEPEDPMPKLQAACEKTKECGPLKHHYDECAERVTRQHEEHGKADEDCVEEFFHLMHCTSQCAAPKLFRQLR